MRVQWCCQHYLHTIKELLCNLYKIKGLLDCCGCCYCYFISITIQYWPHMEQEPFSKINHESLVVKITIKMSVKRHSSNNEKMSYTSSEYTKTTDWFIDWIQVLCPTRHKMGHFGDVLQVNLLAWYGKTKPNATKAHIHQSKEMYCNTK